MGKQLTWTHDLLGTELPETGPAHDSVGRMAGDGYLSVYLDGRGRPCIGDMRLPIRVRILVPYRVLEG